jgi:hypothetical protein
MITQDREEITQDAAGRVREIYRETGMFERKRKKVVASSICPLFFLSSLMKSSSPPPLSINYDVHLKFSFGSLSSPFRSQQAGASRSRCSTDFEIRDVESF